MAASDARPVPRKNVAYRVTFPILDADGDLVTAAASLDSEVSGDGGTFADCTNEATEIPTSSGVYYLDLTSGEMNYDTVAIIVKTSTSGAKTTVIVLYPEEVGDVRADMVQISGDTAAADNAESMFDGTGYAGGTVKLGVDACRSILRAGANNFGGTLMEETISRMAGAEWGIEMTPDQFDDAIRAIGRTPVVRTTTYDSVRWKARQAS